MPGAVTDPFREKHGTVANVGEAWSISINAFIICDAHHVERWQRVSID
jgi:hypothetical protein